MPWFKVDDGFHCHPKAMRAGTAALGLWVRCGSWSAQQLTEGFVPDEIVKLYGTQATAKALVAAGLFERVDGGYQMHQFLERNPSREKVEEERAAAVERQRRARDKAKRKREEEMSRRDTQQESHQRHGVTETDVTPVSRDRHGPPDPTRPDPTRNREVPTTSGAKRQQPKSTQNAQDVVAAWIEGAQEHSGERPGGRLINQVGKQARELLDEGKDLGRLITAAREAGRKGFADLPRELMRMGRPQGDPQTAWMRGAV